MLGQKNKFSFLSLLDFLLDFSVQSYSQVWLSGRVCVYHLEYRWTFVQFGQTSSTLMLFLLIFNWQKCSKPESHVSSLYKTLRQRTYHILNSVFFLKSADKFKKKKFFGLTWTLNFNLNFNLNLICTGACFF